MVARKVNDHSVFCRRKCHELCVESYSTRVHRADIMDLLHWTTLRTSSETGFGGGGKVVLSTLRSFALRAPLEDLAFFPIVTVI
jgi:hypothetical protein